MDKPIISVIGAAIKTKYWLRCYESIARNNQTPFEMIFVGRTRPDFPLPDNFRHIYSTVKPPQCVEIASREAKGEYLFPISDDLIFATMYEEESALGNLYEYALRLNDDTATISCRYELDGKVLDHAHCFTLGNPFSPFVPICALMKTKTYRKLGGIDRRFVAIYWDIDLYMRFFEIGGKPFIAPNVFARDDSGKGSYLWGRFECLDRPLLNSLWMTETKYSKTRLAPVESFDDENIFTITQGNKGESRGGNDIWT